ncbi:uncharacterized protein LOC120844447 [Ixodes scapularis]|uniref:uncharacterized protein LOC120844447 n=1 Tax=Ixodes scapularis TaxID=6945 RepID=UPI001A9D5916|nr:uncharacterized protein LOC120844447 [Ixodes scapularis]
MHFITLSDAEALIDRISKLNLCPGAGVQPVAGKCPSFNGNCFHKKCTLLTKDADGACINCKYQRKLIMNQLSRRRCKKVKSKPNKTTAIRRTLRRMRVKLQKAQVSLSQLKAKNEQLPEEVLSEKIKGLPLKQQAAVRACFEAARRKSKKGMRYEKDWLLECILIRMRSPKLYKHLRRHDILALPGRTCLKKAMQHFKSGFGFNPNVFATLCEKTKTMDEFSRHGIIAFDEMKLSEHIDVKSSGSLEGFVDLGQFGEENSSEELADHGLVVVFQPFSGTWMQILGVFSSKSNVKANLLAKIVLEATLLCEQAGLFVDGVTCDAASWNRSMWRIFGIRGKLKGLVAQLK